MSCTKSSGDENKKVPTKELAVPKEITIEPSNSSAVLSWTAVQGVDGYNLELASNRSFTNVFATISSVVKTTYIFQNLSTDTKYYVRIRAVKNTLSLFFHVGMSKIFQPRVNRQKKL